MEYSFKPRPITPRIIIHGGAGNITRENMPAASYEAYRSSLLNILDRANKKLSSPSATALDIATYAVSLLELDPLFNAGHGAVYTTAGTHELEASVMVSRGYRKRGVGVMKVRRTKSPIKLAREMLLRGETENGGGAQGHSQLEGETIDKLAEQWGLERVKPSYFWTRKRWDEHRRGLGLEHGDETYEKKRREADENVEEVFDGKQEQDWMDQEEMSVGDIHWDGKEYLPQGTVGAVVLDSSGVLCAATSTGGLTNKLSGRIGDTPTLGAGFWAEEFHEDINVTGEPSLFGSLTNITSAFQDCLPALPRYALVPSSSQPLSSVRAVAMSGTGNGDSFLRVNAVRTAAAIARYSSLPGTSSWSRVYLQRAVQAVAGPHGQLQHSAGDRWKKTGEGEGGIIGIELVDGEGKIVFDFNCGGMFHAWVDDEGKGRFELFQDSPRPSW
ncbi:hypothetical protein M409DRAFT_63796 [Zasmidium cellare ATCC 36951]|uniref:N-terminal nucleophile aminohydrolase n=1 Tax=Zasmidium cellare ATCC 36951 TaxID=1080233 RepID=A0A6A6D084_ZASCE|nr:uncharacterized protein M409DRAFT_63796 [Zasmidium cellare ATCC 36951]KAF2171572.1 hypothetical protein M409DRAFT_63796 [Zasmidium cellare ATCC 36951]